MRSIPKVGHTQEMRKIIRGKKKQIESGKTVNRMSEQNEKITIRDFKKDVVRFGKILNKITNAKKLSGRKLALFNYGMRLGQTSIWYECLQHQNEGKQTDPIILCTYNYVDELEKKFKEIFGEES